MSFVRRFHCSFRNTGGCIRQTCLKCSLVEVVHNLQSTSNNFLFPSRCCCLLKRGSTGLRFLLIAIKVVLKNNPGFVYWSSSWPRESLWLVELPPPQLVVSGTRTKGWVALDRVPNKSSCRISTYSTSIAASNQSVTIQYLFSLQYWSWTQFHCATRDTYYLRVCPLCLDFGRLLNFIIVFAHQHKRAILVIVFDDL